MSLQGSFKTMRGRRIMIVALSMVGLLAVTLMIGLRE